MKKFHKALAKSNNGGIVKHYNNGQELSTKVLNGVNKLADNVGSTLGPREEPSALCIRERTSQW